MTTFTARGVPLAEGSDAADIAARVNPVAQLHHDRPGVSPLTTAQRDALAGSELWDGRVILNTTTDRLQRYDLGNTAWVDIYPASAPAGCLGYAQVTSGQAITTLTDWAGLSVTVTVPAGRRIKVTGNLYYNPSASGLVGFAYVYEGTTSLQQRGTVLPTAGISDALEIVAILTPTAGTHTYKLAGTVNTGTLTLAAGANVPSFILVEDIGAA